MVDSSEIASYQKSSRYQEWNDTYAALEKITRMLQWHPEERILDQAETRLWELFLGLTAWFCKNFPEEVDKIKAESSRQEIALIRLNRDYLRSH